MGAKIEAVKGRSPYATKGKTPFKYGEAYTRYDNAVGVMGAGRYTPEAEAADRAFRRQFGIPTYFNGARPLYG